MNASPCKRLLLTLSLVLTMLLVSAAGLAQQDPQPKEPAQEQTDDKTEATSGSDAEPQEASGDEAPSGQKLLEEASQIATEVANIRGLSLQAEIDKGIRTRAELRKVLIAKLAEEVTDEEVVNEAKVYKQLGLMPEELDYKQTLLDVLTEQIAGFYDQDAKELYIMKGIPLSLQRPAMAHEIFHAIQDQHFDIKRMVEPISSQENGDFALARSALIEGDASLVMIDFSLYEEGVLPQDNVRSVVDIPMMANILMRLTQEDVGALQQMVPQGGAAVSPAELAESALADAPRMVRKLLVFPYFGGMRFVISARSGHNWERINHVYENPPVSTEQILHPQRYFAQDTPVLLDFEAASVIDDAPAIYDSVFGEYQMRLVLEQHLLEGENLDEQRQLVDRAMTGWDGDRIRAFEPEGADVLLTHLSVWDTIRDAREYFEAMGQVLERRFPEAKMSHNRGKYGQSICLVLQDGEQAERVYLEQWGDLVLHVEGAPSRGDTKGQETDPTTHMLREQIFNPFEKVWRERLEQYDAERAEAPSTDDGAKPAE